MDRLTYIVVQQRFSKAKRPSQSWSLFYGDNKTAWFGPTLYAHCASEKKRLMEGGHGYKAEFFKIK